MQFLNVVLISSSGSKMLRLMSWMDLNASIESPWKFYFYNFIRLDIHDQTNCFIYILVHTGRVCIIPEHVSPGVTASPTPANQIRPIATWDSYSSRKAPWVSHVPPEPPDIDIFVSQQWNQIPIGTLLRSGQWINIMFSRLQKSVPASLWWARLGYQTMNL